VATFNDLSDEIIEVVLVYFPYDLFWSLKKYPTISRIVETETYPVIIIDSSTSFPTRPHEDAPIVLYSEFINLQKLKPFI